MICIGGKKKLNSRADELPGLGLVKHSSVSYMRDVAVQTCWVVLSRAKKGGKKVASFQLAPLNYSVESIALARLQFYLSNECAEIADITLCCKSNLVLIDSARFTKPRVMASCAIRAYCGVICIGKMGPFAGSN